MKRYLKKRDSGVCSPSIMDFPQGHTELPVGTIHFSYFIYCLINLDVSMFS